MILLSVMCFIKEALNSWFFSVLTNQGCHFQSIEPAWWHDWSSHRLTLSTRIAKLLGSLLWVGYLDIYTSHKVAVEELDHGGDISWFCSMALLTSLQNQHGILLFMEGVDQSFSDLLLPTLEPGLADIFMYLAGETCVATRLPIHVQIWAMYSKCRWLWTTYASGTSNSLVHGCRGSATLRFDPGQNVQQYATWRLGRELASRDR